MIASVICSEVVLLRFMRCNFDFYPNKLPMNTLSIQRLERALSYRSQRFLRKLRDTHARLLFRVLLHWGSQPSTVTQTPAIIFSPHQDDEVLGCGGMIALKRQQQIPVRVVFLTDGRGSHSQHPRITPQELIRIRKQEAIAALSILGVPPSDITFLDRIDGSLQQMTVTEQQHTIEQLTQILNAFKPGEVYVPHRHDRHPDHEATYDLVQAALARSAVQADLLQYPIWVFWKSLLLLDLKVRELAGARRLSIQTVQDKKQQAIAAYRSQCLPIDAYSPVVLSPGFLKRFFVPHEVFFKPES